MNRRRSRTSAARRAAGRALVLAVVLELAMLAGGSSVAGARCVTAGVDSISHTQCDLP